MGRRFGEVVETRARAFEIPVSAPAKHGLGESRKEKAMASPRYLFDSDRVSEWRAITRGTSYHTNNTCVGADLTLKTPSGTIKARDLIGREGVGVVTDHPFDPSAPPVRNRVIAAVHTVAAGVEISTRGGAVQVTADHIFPGEIMEFGEFTPNTPDSGAVAVPVIAQEWLRAADIRIGDRLSGGLVVTDVRQGFSLNAVRFWTEWPAWVHTQAGVKIGSRWHDAPSTSNGYIWLDGDRIEKIIVPTIMSLHAWWSHTSVEMSWTQSWHILDHDGVVKSVSEEKQTAYLQGPAPRMHWGKALEHISSDDENGCEIFSYGRARIDALEGVSHPEAIEMSIGPLNSRAVALLTGELELQERVSATG